MYASVISVAMCVQVPKRTEKDIGSPGAGATSDCEPLIVSAEN